MFGPPLVVFPGPPGPPRAVDRCLEINCLEGDVVRGCELLDDRVPNFICVIKENLYLCN